jgi:hypothetical protein
VLPETSYYSDGFIPGGCHPPVESGRYARMMACAVDLLLLLLLLMLLLLLLLLLMLLLLLIMLLMLLLLLIMLLMLMKTQGTMHQI